MVVLFRINSVSTQIFYSACSLAFLLTLSHVSFANECADNIRSTDVQRFDDNHDGTLTDIDSGLTWMRCALGQHWDGNTCLGQPGHYTWQSAQQTVREFNQVGGYVEHKDWRVPKLPELAGIVERHCNNPRINLQLFPATPATYFWAFDTKPKTYDQAYVMHFGTKGVTTLLKSDQALVRLVRGRQ